MVPFQPTTAKLGWIWVVWIELGPLWLSEEWFHHEGTFWSAIMLVEGISQQNFFRIFFHPQSHDCGWKKYSSLSQWRILRSQTETCHITIWSLYPATVCCWKSSYCRKAMEYLSSISRCSLSSKTLHIMKVAMTFTQLSSFIHVKLLVHTYSYLKLFLNDMALFAFGCCVWNNGKCRTLDIARH